MNKQKYESILNNTKISLKNWTLIALLLGVSNILITLFVFGLSQNEKTIVMPSHFERPFWVKGGTASKEYVEQISRDIFEAKQNYNPKNVKYQFDTVLKYIHPRYYQEFRSIQDLDVQRILDNQISSALYPVSINIKEGEVSMKAEQVTIVGTKVIERKDKKYTLFYTTGGGNFKVVGYEVKNEKI